MDRKQGDPESLVATYTTKEEPVRDVIRLCHFLMPGKPAEDVATETYVRVGALPKELQKAVRAALQPSLEEHEREAQKRALQRLPRGPVTPPAANVAAQIHDESGYAWKAPATDCPHYGQKS